MQGRAKGYYMTDTQFARFCDVREKIRLYISSISENAQWILEAQRTVYNARGYYEADLETPVVYNLALEDITAKSEPRFIIVADNPGIQEQKAKNHRYLVGQSGKLAVSWFRENLGIDFRSSTLIINKTPIHTPKTAELRLLVRSAGSRSDELAGLLVDSQREMARFAFDLLEILECPLWVSGIGELRPKGIFRPWAEELRALCLGAPFELRERVWLFRHFSMNQFAIEYANARRAMMVDPKEAQNTQKASLVPNPGVSDPGATYAMLAEIGRRNRTTILGF
jgi:hypothetical protein